MTVARREPEGEPEELWASEVLARAVAVGSSCVAEGGAEAQAVPLGLTVRDSVAVEGCEGTTTGCALGEALCERERVPEPDVLDDRVGLRLCEGEVLLEGQREAVPLEDSALRVGESVEEREREGEAVAEPQREGEAVREGESVAEREREGEPVEEGLAEGFGEKVAERLEEAEGEIVGKKGHRLVIARSCANDCTNSVPLE